MVIVFNCSFPDFTVAPVTNDDQYWERGGLIGKHSLKFPQINIFWELVVEESVAEEKWEKIWHLA